LKHPNGAIPTEDVRKCLSVFLMSCTKKSRAQGKLAVQEQHQEEEEKKEKK
jgi:hypothetical protein